MISPSKVIGIASVGQGSCAALSRAEKAQGQGVTLCQRSCAAMLRAEKASGALQNPSNLLTSSNLRFSRLDGWNPHGYWVSGDPSNLLTCFRKYAHTCARTRIRAWVPPLIFFHTIKKRLDEVRRLDEPSVYAGSSRLTFRLTFGRLDE
jgi:hypothetical protein